MTLISALFPQNSDDQDIDGGRLVLGRYTVLGKLTQGGMAEVYLARQKGPAGYSKLVVVKRVKPNLANDKDFVAMFVNEARLAALINHPNVVQIFDLGQDKRDWFLAMEFLDGRDMLQIGRACRALNKAVPFDVTARIIADACHGLEHAHRLVGADGKPLNLVHRDMSPENILITFEGQVKVVDFGIAKARDNAFRTQAGQIKGKLGYVAPEAILGKPLDGRADIFAIGATLYLFLCGRPAFTGSNPMEIFERSLQPAERPSKINSRVPPMLEEICVKCLEREPDARYATANELRLALEEYLHSTGRPMGAPQLSQFMKILFPGDKDPVRQRIDQLLADGTARDEDERKSFLSAETAQAANKSSLEKSSPLDTQLSSALSSEYEYEEEDDSEATAVVPPEERPDRYPTGRAPSAVQLGSEESDTSHGPALKKPAQTSESPRAPGYHLRSVELASQLDQRGKAMAPPVDDVEATLTRPPAFESEPSGGPVQKARVEMTVELDPSLLRELRAGASEPDERPFHPPPFADDGEEELDDLDDLAVDLSDDDELDDTGIDESLHDDERPHGADQATLEVAMHAPPPPPDSSAFDASVEMPPYAADSSANGDGADDIDLDLSPVEPDDDDDGEVTDPSPRRLDASPDAGGAGASGRASHGMALDFDDPGPAVERQIIVKKAPFAARVAMLLAGMLVGSMLVGGGLFVTGELEWMVQRLGGSEPTTTDG